MVKPVSRMKYKNLKFYTGGRVKLKANEEIAFNTRNNRIWENEYLNLLKVSLNHPEVNLSVNEIYVYDSEKYDIEDTDVKIVYEVDGEENWAYLSIDMITPIDTINPTDTVAPVDKATKLSNKSGIETGDKVRFINDEEKAISLMREVFIGGDYAKILYKMLRGKTLTANKLIRNEDSDEFVRIEEDPMQWNIPVECFNKVEEE